MPTPKRLVWIPARSIDNDLASDKHHRWCAASRMGNLMCWPRQEFFILYDSASEQPRVSCACTVHRRRLRA
jgi:hypothetical protein